ncbi:MAG: hypothetical protein OEN50_17270, partial [Deltaproteobacteria bacterium]|nr:hypothetical protein [Deltaproteobacteria bacterium]
MLRYFSTASALLFCVVIVLLGMFYGHEARSHLISLGENKNIALTQAFANSIWPRFVPFFKEAPHLSAEQLRQHPDAARLRSAVLALMKGLPIVKVKVYTLDGRTVFSTQASQVGEDKAQNAGFQAARSGRVASELTHRDTFSAFEQTIEDRDVFSSYVPIRRDPSMSNAVDGVFEIYTDLTPLLQDINVTLWKVLIGMTLAFVGLYGLLFVIVRHADRVIQRQRSALEVEIAAREQLESDLRRGNESLEATVQRRTAELLAAKEAAEASNRAKSEF